MSELSGLHPEDLAADYDWREVFKYAEGFNIDDVAAVLDYRHGENDGPSWIIYGTLLDGRFFRVEAGCDYTGWGCQESGTSSTADTLQDLVLFGMTRDERERYGLLQSEELS